MHMMANCESIWITPLDAETMQICTKGIHMYSNLHGMNLILKKKKEIVPVIFLEQRNEKKFLCHQKIFVTTNYPL